MGGWSNGPSKRAHPDSDSWDYRWDSYTHQELYDMVRTDADGAKAVGPTHQAWTDFTTLIEESQANIEKLLTDAGASWEGQAADSMQQGISPLNSWATEAATAGKASADGTQAHMDAFSSVSNSMPEPVKVPSQATKDVPVTIFPDLFAGQTDEDPAQQKADAAKQEAVEQMNRYTANTQESSGTLGDFAAPEDMGVSAQEPEPGGGTGGMIDSDDYRDSSDGGDSGGYGGGSTPYPTGNGYGPAPGPSSGTDTAQSAGPIPPPSTNLPSSTTSPASSNPFAPVSGTLFPPGGSTPTGTGTPGDRRGGSGGRGSGGGGYVGGGVPGSGAPGAGTPRPGVGTGPLAEGGPVRGGVAPTAAGARGGAAAGGMPMGGAGAGRGDEDKEHAVPGYLRDYHDDLWDDSPPVAPPVIGADDD